LAVAINEAFSVELSNSEIMAMRNVGLVRAVLRRRGVAVA